MDATWLGFVDGSTRCTTWRLGWDLWMLVAERGALRWSGDIWDLLEAGELVVEVEMVEGDNLELRLNEEVERDKEDLVEVVAVLMMIVLDTEEVEMDAEEVDGC